MNAEMSATVTALFTTFVNAVAVEVKKTLPEQADMPTVDVLTESIVTALQRSDWFKEHTGTAAKEEVEDAVNEFMGSYDFDADVERGIQHYDFSGDIKQVLDHYDFGDTISSALENHDFRYDIEQAVDDYDFSDAIDSAIDGRLEDAVEEQMSASIEEKVKNVLADVLPGFVRAELQSQLASVRLTLPAPTLTPLPTAVAA